MDIRSLAPRACYVLYRVHPDDTEELVSKHRDFASSWQAGTRLVTIEDTENAYSLYDRRRRVARFGHNRLMRRVEGLEQVLPKMVGAL